MRLLFDQNLSPKLHVRSADLFPESNHVFPLGLGSVLDSEIWDYAKRGGYSVVTKDADFSDLCTLLGFPPNVVWIRRGNCKTEDVEALLREHVDAIIALEEDEGAGILALF